MVSNFLLQGKPVRPVFIKTRSTTVVTKKTTKGSGRTVPIERKENIVISDALLTQPSCSYTTRQHHTRTIRTGKKIRPKMKKDGFKFKNVAHEKPSTKSINHIMHNMQNTNCLVRQRLKNENKEKSKRGTSETDLDRVQLREICFVKDGDGKKVIAKYTSSESKSESCDDNLIVSWDPLSTHPTVFSQKHPFIPSKSSVEPSCSGKQGAFRVHNFARSNSFNRNKRNKRSLRRLTTSVEQTPKVDKLKKRKKAKGKVG